MHINPHCCMKVDINKLQSHQDHESDTIKINYIEMLSHKDIHYNCSRNSWRRR